MEDTTENPIVQRLKEYIAASGLTSTQFADRAGIPRPSFSQILSGRNKTINNQLLAKLHEHFPDLDILWLLFDQPAGRPAANFEISEPQNPGPEASDFVYVSDNHTQKDAEAAPTSKPYSTAQIENPGPNKVAEPKWTASVLCTPPSDASTTQSGAPTSTVDVPSSPGRTVSSILIIYSDGSFETFTPARAES